MLRAMARSLRILVVDTKFGYSVGGCFTRAFRRLGHQATFFDQFPFLGGGPSGLLTRVARRVSRTLTVPALNAAILATAAAMRPDLVLVLKGQHLRPTLIKGLKHFARTIAVYHTDDLSNPTPTSQNMRQSLPCWDAVFTPRKIAVSELLGSGARAAEHLPFGYDDELHFPATPASEGRQWSTTVVFIGTWAPERPELLESSAKRFPFAIWGGGWDRLDGSSSLVAALQERAVYGESLRQIASGAAINVALLRKANRDQHTMRTFEIPACRGFMLAERTDEHRALFEEDAEAVFFEGPAELEAKIDRYLNDETARRRIAAAGHARLLAGRHTYVDRAARMLKALQG